ncbi:DUF1761 domain-containing protein [Balneolaceae bacterium YR4-1]|uniref:DUF1761 domain-containing protein n=1 Tax=Halalkalibaculum roseum TaxID=2709311 RepID=A0A6M1SMH2_9BACT|nr:DUF1761 domain-containing protein [Halalkalibaculum roseum]NGP76521.1 DUF1761 domain-containing protein [Halalkalibaculum roseum]
MDMSTLNIWAILVATLSTFLVGWLWYGPLFGKSWMTATGLSEEQLQQGNMAKIFGLAFVFELIMAFNLAMFLNDPSIGLQEGTLYGFLTGFGWVFFALAVNALYEQKSWKYILVNGGYWTVTFTVMGLILGAWK